MTPMRMPYPRDYAEINPPEDPEPPVKVCKFCGGQGCEDCQPEPEPMFDTEEERDGKA